MIARKQERKDKKQQKRHIWLPQELFLPIPPKLPRWGKFVWEECSLEAYIVDVNRRSPPISPRWGKLCGDE
jgi:hypothetical protein